MTGDDFFAHFETLVDAPGGIPKLREFILQLAIQGKLVVQDTGDGSAKQQYERMKSAKSDSRNSRTNPTSFEPVDEAETPFPIPSNWKWCRIGEAMNLHNGRAFKPSDWASSGIPIIRIQNLNNPHAPFNHFDGEVGEKNIVKNGDFLISWSGTPGTSFGAFIWAREQAVLNQHIFRADLLGGAFEKPFLRCAINARLEEMIAKAHGGVGLQHITKGKLENLTIPLPPLAEQQRIVAQVDRLMALCDALEAQQQARHAVRGRLHATLLGNLQTAANAADFARAWQRLRDHFAELFTPGEAALDAVAQLRQTSLQLAVQGKLVPQEDGDEAKQTAAAGVEVNEEPELFAVPPGWRWTRLRDAEISLKYGTSVRCGYENSGVPVLRIPNVVKGRMDFDDLKRGPLGEKEQGDLRLQIGDLLIIRSNGSTSIVGRTAVVEGAAVGMAYAGYLVRLRQNGKTWTPEFLHLAMKTILVREQIERPIRTTSGVKNINSTEIGRICIPVPPLAEQHRIVAKVQQLMAQCDALEANLKAAATVSERWSAAAVRRLLGG